ncbi:MAG: hypothetical protein ABSG75_07625 [Syntrophales bacterium]
MDRELKHPNHSDALQGSNNHVSVDECVDTSGNPFNNLNVPFYCTINEVIKVCPSLRQATITRNAKQGIIEARRVISPHGRGYRYEIAIYNSIVKEKVLKLRQEKEVIEEKRRIVKLKKIIKNLDMDIDENNIKEHIISLL